MTINRFYFWLSAIGFGVLGISLAIFIEPILILVMFFGWGSGFYFLSKDSIHYEVKKK